MTLKIPVVTGLGILLCYATINAQQVKFSEYNLPNGLHVVLHEDHTAPVVAVSVMYHVGSKNEQPGRTGFAHFFEHLLFEGSDNIKRGEFMKYVSANGGQNNANTTQDRTFYYEVFPSNQLQLGLWLESERMLHPVINEVGVRTQNEVVKEEKRLRVDNQPYGRFAEVLFKDMFKTHPYKWQPIGSMEDLDAARLDEFKNFFKQYYTPDNAVLVVTGDFDVSKTKELINSYFAAVPKGPNLLSVSSVESPITKQIIDTVYDTNIQIPAIFAGYRMPGFNNNDSRVLQMISSVLSGGASSRLQKKMVDEKKNALQVAAFNYGLEDYGAYLVLALPNNNASLDELLKDMDAEVSDLQTNLISASEYQKVQNKFENDFVSTNSTMLGVAQNLAEGYTFYKNTNNINEEMAAYKAITREQIREVAKKYLGKDQRVLLYYLPDAKAAQN